MVGFFFPWISCCELLKQDITRSSQQGWLLSKVDCCCMLAELSIGGALRCSIFGAHCAGEHFSCWGAANGRAIEGKLALPHLLPPFHIFFILVLQRVGRSYLTPKRQPTFLHLEINIVKVVEANMHPLFLRHFEICHFCRMYLAF